MGQKVHPFGFRLGITERHKSNWYTKYYNYADRLKLDSLLRLHVIEILKKLGNKQNEEIADRSNIFIYHNEVANTITIEIKALAPSLLLEKIRTNKEILKFSGELKSLLENKEILLTLVKLTDPNIHSSILAQSLVKKLEKRTMFRRAIRSALEEFKEGATSADLDQTQIGIKIQIAGRLNGAEIARTEWVREGRVPLHTLQAKISYVYETAQTIYGTLGVKIWICTG